jgi:diamine N-acetyltransferase
MERLKGGHICLRALEPDDLEFLYLLENDPNIWEISGTVTPYSKHVLRQYLDNAHRDIYDVKQLRLAICKHDGPLVGLIDLFDFDPKNHRAGIGIVVMEAQERNKGVGSEAIGLLTDYAFASLDVHQIFANVGTENKASLHLFKKMGFREVGVKKDWVFYNGSFKDEILLQKIRA